MTPEHADLWKRIEAFDIDGPEPPLLTFGRRLAREHGWTQAYTRRVITEYKRFVFLAITSRTVMTPSEQVDEAWHMHLTYTHSYWQRLCKEVLGQPLHHNPTRGGDEESTKYKQHYEETLARYRATFGHDAPADIWPDTETRFGEDLHHVQINTTRNWVIPKEPTKRLTAGLSFAILAVVCGIGCVGDFKPFGLVGVEFIWFLLPVLLVAMVCGRFLRSTYRVPVPQPGDEEIKLTWDQTAYMVGGIPRLATAAIARLAASGLVKVSDDTNQLLPIGTTPKDLSDVELAVWRCTPIQKTPKNLYEMYDVVKNTYAAQAEQLEANGMMTTAETRRKMAWAGVAPVLAVLIIFAVPRLIMGLSNEKPVGYLIATIVIGLIVGFVVTTVGNIRLTRRGQKILDNTRARYATNRKLEQSANPDDTGLMVALLGTTALAGTSYVALNHWLPRRTDGDTYGGCGTSFSSDSGGGGGDGGGGDGGGGGGCGGCGGGGD